MKCCGNRGSRPWDAGRSGKARRCGRREGAGPGFRLQRVSSAHETSSLISSSLISFLLARRRASAMVEEMSSTGPGRVPRGAIFLLNWSYFARYSSLYLSMLIAASYVTPYTAFSIRVTALPASTIGYGFFLDSRMLIPDSGCGKGKIGKRIGDFSVNPSSIPVTVDGHVCP